MIITLEQAKHNLGVLDGFDDAVIERCINSAIGWVEKYTDYALTATTKKVYTGGCGTVKVVTYPFNVTTPNVKVRQMALSSVLSYKPNTEIVLNVGNWLGEPIPTPLIEACYKLITYYYENRDMYKQEFPSDVQVLLNQWRRSATV